jgi:hypothetical protein
MTCSWIAHGCPYSAVILNIFHPPHPLAFQSVLYTFFKNRSIFIEVCVLAWLRYTWVIKKENSPVFIYQCKNSSTMLGIYKKKI